MSTNSEFVEIAPVTEHGKILDRRASHAGKIIEYPLTTIQLPREIKTAEIDYPVITREKNSEHRYNLEIQKRTVVQFFLKHHPAGYTEKMSQNGIGTEKDPFLDAGYALDKVGCYLDNTCTCYAQIIVMQGSTPLGDFDYAYYNSVSGRAFNRLIFGSTDEKTFFEIAEKSSSIYIPAAVVSQVINPVAGKWGRITQGWLDYVKVCLYKSKEDKTVVGFDYFRNIKFRHPDDDNVEFYFSDIYENYDRNQVFARGEWILTLPDESVEVTDVVATGYWKDNVPTPDTSGNMADFYVTAVDENGNMTLTWANGTEALFIKHNDTFIAKNFHAPNLMHYDKVTLKIYPFDYFTDRFSMTGTYAKKTSKKIYGEAVWFIADYFTSEKKWKGNGDIEFRKVPVEYKIQNIKMDLLAEAADLIYLGLLWRAKNVSTTWHEHELGYFQFVADSIVTDEKCVIGADLLYNCHCEWTNVLDPRNAGPSIVGRIADKCTFINAPIYCHTLSRCTCNNALLGYYGYLNGYEFSTDNWYDCIITARDAYAIDSLGYSRARSIYNSVITIDGYAGGSFLDAKALVSSTVNIDYYGDDNSNRVSGVYVRADGIISNSHVTMKGEHDFGKLVGNQYGRFAAVHLGSSSVAVNTLTASCQINIKYTLPGVDLGDCLQTLSCDIMSNVLDKDGKVVSIKCLAGCNANRYGDCYEDDNDLLCSNIDW